MVEFVLCIVAVVVVIVTISKEAISSTDVADIAVAIFGGFVIFSCPVELTIVLL